MEPDPAAFTSEMPFGEGGVDFCETEVGRRDERFAAYSPRSQEPPFWASIDQISNINTCPDLALCMLIVTAFRRSIFPWQWCRRRWRIEVDKVWGGKSDNWHSSKMQWMNWAISRRDRERFELFWLVASFDLHKTNKRWAEPKLLQYTLIRAKLLVL